MSAPTGKVCWTIPTYIGNRHARIRGERYDAFIDAYVGRGDGIVPERAAAMGRLRAGQRTAHPREVPRPRSARSTTICRAPAQSLWRRRSRPFASAGRRCGTSAWSFSARARQVSESPTRFAMPWCARACPKRMRPSRFWCVDRQGLLTTDMADTLHDYQAAYARPAAESKSWKRDGGRASAWPRWCAASNRPC